MIGLSRQRAALLVVDIQDRLAPAAGRGLPQRCVAASHRRSDNRAIRFFSAV